MTRIASRAVCVVLAVCVAGCGFGQEVRLRKGVSFADEMIRKAGTDAKAAAALRTIEEDGQGIVHYVVRSLTDPSAYPPFQEERPTGPWVVVIRITAVTGHYIIEGYGDSLTKPLFSRSVTIPMRR